MPRTIVEDKMDRQNSTISQRFFAKEVEDILMQNGHYSEAEFVRNTRNWFRACDERGMEITDGIKKISMQCMNIWWGNVISLIIHHQ